MKVINKYIYCLLLLPVLMTGTKAIAQLPSNRLVQQLITVLDSSYTYFQTSLEKQAMMAQRFDSLFNLLAYNETIQNTSIIGEDNMQQKLVAIARYKKQYPNLFQEVAQKYIYGIDNPRLVAPASPQLVSAFEVEKYRLVWEFFLLYPPAENMSPQYHLRVASAIAAIHHPASVVTLESVYTSLSKAKGALDYPVLTRQQLLLLTIGNIPSEEGALSLVRLVQLPVQPVKSTRVVDWKPLLFVKDILKNQRQLSATNNWQPVLNRVERRAGMDTASKKILKDLNHN